TLSSYLNEGAAELTTVRSRIEALENQLELEKAKLASIDNVSLNDVNAEYQALEMELQFATDLYKTTIVALERARVESYHKLKHLIVIQSPTLPDEAAYPRKLYDLATLFIGLTLLYGIITMILATIREHRDV
ncbi:MAG: sugar transporter, partial [Kordiimonas sp.]